MEKVAKTLDARGKFCPIPVMETAKAINEVKVGEVLEVLATDPAADPDIKAWAKRMGHEVILSEKTPEGYLRILIKRLK
ncbi:sulfurtransferase TusA family protein [Thermoproteus tenax]|uniref:Predicted redox protein, regulator of disulfide bond formation n=1 Tax=Thermoproteus tenax (strain ATCC 35583 / DSM 2078 / JCM 9277 / NBRC 100435 / Kra 1) TaxID=768679 RepID=G4RNE1_THETK|nr:sulfurtransferase TusA family protein [Thermoproteus tenax]CCC81085.1 predicted redox protein, regulator of disulfide bond formation [Thermoproteus tenax Kra 1]